MEFAFSNGNFQKIGHLCSGLRAKMMTSVVALSARRMMHFAAVCLAALMLCPALVYAQERTAAPQSPAEANRVAQSPLVPPPPPIYNDASSVQESDSVGVDEWQQHWYLKTNFAGWILAMTNFGGEVDVAKHWSVSLSLYYSGWNYFTYKVKFRTFTIQPEARYWFAEQNDGWFVGAHLGLGWFNFATGGEYRIQDHDRRTPAIGGGINGGYRLLLTDRCKMEFSLGVGVYAVNYDKFINEPNGKLVSNEKKAYFGPDQINISFLYTFDIDRKKEKGGKR